MLSRRSILAAGAAGLTALSLPSCKRSSSVTPRISITMDDFNLPANPRLEVGPRNEAILDAFDAFGLKAAGFVTGSFVDSAQGRAVVQSWSDRGHMLGNHTFTHSHASRTDIDEYKADILRNHEFMKDYAGYQKVFRFPYLDEGGLSNGGSIERRDDYRKFLKDNGFKNGAVTLSPSDWYITDRLEKALKVNPDMDVTPYRDFYIDHSLTIARYTQSIATDLGVSGIPHTLLVHHNILNGLFMGDLLKAFADEGWEFVDAKTAFEHPVFDAAPYTPNRGRSLIRVMEQEATEYGESKPRPYPYAEKKLSDIMDGLGL